MTDTTVQGTRPITATNSPFNALSYMMETAMKGLINTAIPVRVDSVSGGGVGPVGYVSATPLVSQVDGKGNALAPQSLPQLPYMRYQGGKVAIICDPMPGDVGIAVFSQQDISTVGSGATQPTQPGSFRAFDMADGMYIGGILNKEPEVWLELTQEGEATLHAPQKITIEALQIVMRGNITTEGTGGESGTIDMRGTVNLQGTLSSTGDQTAGSISQRHHTHIGVQTGSGSTGEPQ